MLIFVKKNICISLAIFCCKIAFFIILKTAFNKKVYRIIKRTSFKQKTQNIFMYFSIQINSFCLRNITLQWFECDNYVSLTCIRNISFPRMKTLNSLMRQFTWSVVRTCLKSTSRSLCCRTTLFGFLATRNRPCSVPGSSLNTRFRARQ